MKRPTLLIAAYTLDHLLGDPEPFPHPVRLIGFAIDRGERLLRRPNQSPSIELLTGATLTVAIVATAYTLTDATIRLTHRQSPTLGNLTDTLLAWTCLAARNLHQEAAAVLAPLVANDLPAARQRLARIVGRDTLSLNSSQISRALIETLAESASDGIVAPLFYLALGGAPLAMAYKAVNTLDSMIGHTDRRYFYFGKAAARLDDAANFLPSRITALALIAAAWLLPEAFPRSAMQVWRRDAHLHKSPNAGQPEAAIAGALKIRLGGPNTYAGILHPGPPIAPEHPPATPVKAAHAMRLVTLASILATALFTTVLSLGAPCQSQRD